jgi:quercetin dioxygenase-like cupin family protein
MNFTHLSSLPEQEIFPGISARVLHTEHVTVAYVTIQAVTLLPEHAHPQEQVCNVLRGQLEMTIEGDSQVLAPGITATIAPNLRHSGRALTDCLVLDIFHPHRTY